MASKILVDIAHPAHFHFFFPAMEIWQSRGYELVLATRDKDITLDLLDNYGLPYTLLSRARPGMVALLRETENSHGHE